jgi:hypothetical protein
MKLLTRPRRLAVAVLALGAGMAGAAGGVTPAEATPTDGWECMKLSVWTYKSGGSNPSRGEKTYHYREHCVLPTPLGNDIMVPVGAKSDIPPEGMPGGAGVDIWPPTA